MVVKYQEKADTGKVYINGVLIRIEKRSRINGLLHCTDGPAVEWYYPNGKILCHEYYFDGVRHRIDGPAKEEWHENGMLKSRTYYVRGKFHRTDGPAVESWYHDGKLEQRAYYINNKLTCINNNPSMLMLDTNGSIIQMTYFINGSLAFNMTKSQKQWFINNRLVREEKYYSNDNIKQYWFCNETPINIAFDEKECA